MSAGAVVAAPGTLAPPDIASDWRLPDADWERFHASYWERQATVLRHVFARPIVSPAELFDALVEASDRYRAGDASVLVSLYVDHTQALVDVGPRLPMRVDGSTAAYAARVGHMLGDRPFALVVEQLQAYSPPLYLRLRHALAGLFACTGIPDATKATAFVGNYASTPFGLHRGNGGTMAFVIEGPKRLRTWPDAYFRGKPDYTHRLDYHAHDAHATVLDGDAGDVIYWPSDHWHIAERVGDTVSSAVSVATFMERDHEDALLSRAMPLLRRRLRRLAEDADDAALVAALADTAASAALARDLRVARLTHATSLGFTHRPAPLAPESLGDDAVVQGDPLAPIAWTDADDERLAVSAHGHAFGLTRSALVVSLLERLNAGEPLRVGDLLRDYSGESHRVETSREAVRGVLEKLVSIRGLGVVGAA